MREWQPTEMARLQATVRDSGAAACADVTANREQHRYLPHCIRIELIS
jgi:hypothetical protein